MSKGRMSRAQLGLFATLVMGLFALVAAPGIALATSSGNDSHTSNDNSFNLGGLQFTKTGGSTVTTVSMDNTSGVITVSGGNANFTVTQTSFGTGSTTASGLIIGGGAAAAAPAAANGSGNYTGTLTLQGVTLSNSTTPVLQFQNNGSQNGNSGATVVLASGTKLSATGNTSEAASLDATLQTSAASPAATVTMGNYTTAAGAGAGLGSLMASGTVTPTTDDTLTIQSGASVTGTNITAIQVGVPSGAEKDSTSSSTGDVTINMAGGSITGGAPNKSGIGTEESGATAAVTFNTSGQDDDGSASGSLTFEVTGNSTITGNNGTGAGQEGGTVSGCPALSVNSAGQGETSAVFVTGSGSLGLTAGASVLGQNALTPGSPAVYISDGTLLFEGPGTTTITGGHGSDNTSSKIGNDSGVAEAGALGSMVTMSSGGSSATGGAGIAITGTASLGSTVDVEGGTLNVTGGLGGAAYTDAQSPVEAAALLADNTEPAAAPGAPGGPGISLTGSTASGSEELSALNIFGGEVNITGGEGGNGSVTVPGAKGAGGVGLQGDTTGSGQKAEGSTGGCFLNIAYDPELGTGSEAPAMPVVTIQGGMGGGTVGTSANTASGVVNAAENGAGEQQQQQQQETTTTPGVNISIQNYLDGSSANELYPWVAYGTTSGVAPTAQNKGVLDGFAGQAGDLTTLGALATPSGTLQSWLRVEPAEVTGLSAGVVYANSDGTPASYLVAQTTMVGLLPQFAYSYYPSISATFEGLENVITSNFASLVGLGGGGSKGYGISPSDLTFTPAANAAVPASQDYFYVVNTAQGNSLTIALNSQAVVNKISQDFTDLYPDLTTVGEVTLPVVYTVTITNGTGTVGNITAGTPGATASTSSTGPVTVYTAPDGSGNLVLPAGGAVTTMDTTAPTPLQTIVAYSEGIKPAFLGLFNESGEAPTQVNNAQVSGWSANSQLVAEWGSVVLGSVTPSPTQLDRGQSTQVAATYTVTPNNKDITSYSLFEAGLNANWQNAFVGQGTSGGNGVANGLTVEQTGGSTSESSPFEVTSEATVTANATADLGNYQVWPQWGNTLGNDGLPTGKSIFGVVEVQSGQDEPTVTTIDVVRLYNPFSLEHLYTTDANEVAALSNAGWDNEGIAWVAPTQSATPIYRLYNHYNGDHLYTVSQEEYDQLQTDGWTGEGQKLWSAPNTGEAIYRLFNPYMTENAGAYSHLWTGDFTEYTELGTLGWKQEGVAWFALSVPEPTS